MPSDSHVHTEWSWDAARGSMDRTCAQAVRLGLPSVAFTEHVDLLPWTVSSGAELPARLQPHVVGDVFTPPPFDVDGYLACLDRCRQRYPSLRIYSGVELGEPHWHAGAVRDLLSGGRFERLLASVHSTRTGTGGVATEVGAGYDDRPPDQVVRDYLREVVRLVTGFEDFQVLAHIDYPVRSWPADAGPFDPLAFEDELRDALGALAAADKVLELNTRVPLHPLVLDWWHRAGGEAITFGSDAHDPAALAAGFGEAVAVARAAGFRPGSDPLGFWCRA